MSLIERPKWRTIPLLCRKIVLRVLLTSAVASLLFGIPLVASDNFGWNNSVESSRLMVCPVTPLLIILHHVVRLWPRRYWVVLCEFLFSVVETVLVGIYLLRDGPFDSFSRVVTNPQDLAANITALYCTASVILGASSLVTFIFLLFDLFNERGETLLCPYDFSSGLYPSGRKWGFIWGSFTTRKRFSTDNRFTRRIRGGLAIICLLGIFTLVLYAVIWKPLLWSSPSGAKISKVPVLQGAVGTLGSMLGGLNTTWQIVLTFPNQLTEYQHTPTVTVNLKPFPSNSDLSGMEMRNCSSYSLTTPIVVQCPWNIDLSWYISAVPLEPLIMIDFVEAPHGFAGAIHGFMSAPHEVEVRIGASGTPIEDILIYTDPVILGPGSNLYGLSVISVKERFSGKGSAAFGIPHYHQFPIVNMHTVISDWESSIPRNNQTATLRVATRPQAYIDIEQEYLEWSMLNGFALIGGIWTLVNGLFAAIFGSTLLLILFGIKPLSIYGLIHSFRPGRGSLVDANYVLSPEERDRIVGILREHLLDVDDIERDGVSPYNRVKTLSLSDREGSDVDVQV